MAYIIEVPNPFEPLKDIQKHTHPGGISIWDWLRKTYPGFTEFSVPTICLVNGQALLRAQWGRIIAPNDIVNFITVPAGAFAIIAIVLAVASIALSLFLTPPMPGETPASDPVYSVKGQGNGIRLGEPIEVSYGRNRIYPSYAARPYYQYENNDQFLFSLFCLGQGEYDITAVQIGDSAIADYQEATYEITPPGQSVALFPTAVYTASEVGNLELPGPNEEGYTAPGWIGPFFAVPSGETATQLQIDLIMPKGLYQMNSEGDLRNQTIYFEAQARLVDDAGNPLGDWISLWAEWIIATTTTPQRKTYSANITEGRYEVRVRRTTDKDLSTRTGHDLVWDGLRSYLTAAQNWGDVTLLAVKIRATNNLNERTQNQINVIATRKLAVYASGSWSTIPVATRSIIWAYCDIFRSLYGARLEDLYLDLDALSDLDALYTARQDYFDFTFRDSTTVWEAARTVAKVGRAIPLLIGSLISIKRDGPLSVPVALFNQDNVIKGSFQYSVRLSRLEDVDSIQAEYTDPDTGYRQEIVTAELESAADNPRDVRMLGVQNRAHAYREALYMLASERYVREVMVFDTGMEGFIPSFGDLIAIAHDVPRWGQGGYVVQAEEMPAQGRVHLWVSEPLRWEESGGYVILLRGRYGDVLGPFEALETSDPLQVEILAQESGGIDFLLGGQNEPMLFLFGLSDQITKYAKVVRIEPQGGEVVRITAVNYAPEVHTYDGDLPAALPTTPTTPPTPDLPEVTSLVLTQVEGVSTAQVKASWTAAAGSKYYTVQTSEDNVHWQDRGIAYITSLTLDCYLGTLWVRVAGVNTGQGPWCYASLVVSPIIGLAREAESESDVLWRVAWFAVAGATGYLVRIYDDTESEPYLLREALVSESTYSYLLANAESDAGSAGGIASSMQVTVNPVYPTGEYSGAPASLTLSV